MSKTSHASLSATGNALEERFALLASQPDAPEFKSLIDELRLWLNECVENGRFLPPGSADRRSLQAQVDYWTSRLQQAGQDFEEIDRLAPFDPKVGHVLADDLFPYHGLLAATGRDKVFAGREDQVKEYADHIDGHPALLIQSESGGGKSSVAMAGVLPELQRRHPDWLVLARVTPGTQPADTLREALGGLLALGTVDAPAVLAAMAGGTVLVYVDQLEELLTMCTDTGQQQAFCDLLADLAGAGVLRLMATMRVDHYERLAHSAACHRLYGLLTRDGSVKTLTPMSLAQIRSVILKPAEAVGLRFVPASIVDTLASEAANAPSGLPLLQFALQRLWDERPRQGDRPDGPRLDMITAESFAKLPTVSSALGRVADIYFEEMQALGLVDACRRLMLELTVIDERLEVPLRRRRAEAEVLATLVGVGLASADQAQALIEGLVQRRLLVRSGEGNARQIEVAHEALFRYWGKFQDWINKDEVRATLRSTRQISRDSLLWERSGRSHDLLNLRGKPLEEALAHRHGHWLEPLAAAYVDACNAAVAAEDQQKEAASKALIAAETERQRALDEAQERRRAAVRLKWGGVAVTACLLLGIGWLSYQKRSLEATKAANNFAVSFVLPQLQPMEALDLAFTLRKTLKTPESLATLAHAIDDTLPAVLVGERKNGAAFFTFSGRATVQLVATDRGLDHALVRTLGTKLDDLKAAVKVPLDLQADEDLARLDVGPPGDDGSQLVVTTFIGQLRSQRPLMTRLKIHRIGGPSSGVEALDEIRFPNDPQPTRNASHVAFDSSGRRLAISAWLDVPPGPAGEEFASRIIHWAIGQKARIDELPERNAQAVSALAFLKGMDDPIKGRQNGSIDCGPDRRIQVAGLQRVVQLRAAGDVAYVALFDDNSIWLGECGGREPMLVQAASQARAGQLLLRQGSNSGTIVLTYTLQGRLVCRFLGKEDKEQGTCSVGHGLFADSAVPAVDDKGTLVGYRVLENEAPLMMFWDLGRGGGSTPDDPDHALPVAWERDGKSTPAVAGASSKQDAFRVAIAPVKDKPWQFEAYRVDARDERGEDLAVESPQRVAVNDRGIAVVLASRSAQNRHFLSAVAPNGSAQSVKTFEDAACMKLSPDGQQVLVASERWAAMRLPLDGTPLKEIRAYGYMKGDPTVRRDRVSACAMGNGPDPAVVLGSEDGSVLRFDAKSEKWMSLSELVTFSLGGRAMDISIDADSRFVAAVSRALPARCRNGADGHLLRIWDLKSTNRPDFPLASACIPNFGRTLTAIGPVEKQAAGWVLPLYHEVRYPGGVFKVRRSGFPCLACDDGSGAAEIITKSAEELGARKLADGIDRKYGIKLGD